MTTPITLNRTNHSTSTFSLKLIFIIVGASLLVGAVYAHIHLAGSEEYTGPLAVLDHIFDVILALALSIVVLSVGHAIAKGFKLDFASTAEDISFSVFLGTGVVGLSVLCLGLIGLLRLWSIAALLILTIGLTARHWPELYRTIKAGTSRATLTRERQLVSILFLFLLALLVLRALTPPSNGDELTYHLPVIKEFVDHGRVYPSYDNALGNVPFLIHMIYALCLTARSDVAGKLFSLMLAITTALSLYGFCTRFLTRRVGAIALFAFFAAGMVVEIAVTARIDVSLAGMLFVATYAMMNYLETEQLGWFWVSAMLAGFSLGIKHSAGLWLIFVGVMYLIERLVRKREHFATVLKHGIAYTFIAATIASPWYIKNYVWFHNPVYPFFTGELADFGPQGIRYFNADDEHKLDVHFERTRQEIPEVVNEQEGELKKAIDARLPRHPMRLWEFFTRPESYLMSEPFQLPNYLFLLIPLILFLKPRGWVLWLLVLSLAFAFTVAASSWIARYLLPVYPPLTIVTAHTLERCSNRLNKRAAFVQRLPIWPVAISLSAVIVISVSLMVHFNSFRYVTGSISRHEYLLRFPYRARTDFINSKLPATSRIMLVGAQITYGLKREYLSDESWFATKWRRLLVRNSSLEEVNQDLKGHGFTHILYCPGLFTYAAKMGIRGTGGTELMSQSQNLSDEARRLGPEYQLLRNWSTFTLYRGKFLETIYSDNYGCEVLQIK